MSENKEYEETQNHYRIIDERFDAKQAEADSLRTINQDLLEALEWAEAALDAACKVCEIRGDSAGAGHLRIALSKSRAALKKAKP